MNVRHALACGLSRFLKRCLSLSVGLCLIGAGSATAQDQAIPPLTARVIDQTQTLTTAQRDTLSQTLAAFETRKGSQVAVLMVASTKPEAIEQYSMRVFEQWKLGRRGVDDGVLMLVALQDRRIRIEVGYGLEGTLTDAVSRRIIDETITPAFKRQDVYGGIQAGVDRLVTLIDGETLPVGPSRAPPKPSTLTSAMSGWLPVLFIFVLTVGGILRALLGRMLGALITGGLVAGLAWWMGGLAMALLAGIVAFIFSLVGRMGPASAWSSGTGTIGRSGGGWGGGGFGGGGGGFGGGGASGRW